MLYLLIYIRTSIQKHLYRISVSSSDSANKCSIFATVFAEEVGSFFIGGHT